MKKYILNNPTARIVLIFLVLTVLQLAWPRKNIDYALSLIWYLLTITTFAGLLESFNVKRHYKLLLLSLIHFIFLFDVIIKSWFSNSLGISYNNDQYTDFLFVAIQQTNSLEIKEFISHSYSSIVLASIGFLLAFLTLFSFEIIVFKNNKRLPATNSPRKKVYVILLGIWVLLHFQPHTNAEPFYYYPIIARDYLENSSKTDNYIELAKKNAAKINNYNLSASKEPETLVLVIGESASAKNWQIFGYKRDTNLFINDLYEKKEILAFANCFASFPGTVTMLQRIFSIADYKTPDLWQSEPNLIQIANAAGYKSFWFSNQRAAGKNSSFGFSLSKSSMQSEFTGLKASEDANHQYYDELLIKPLTAALKDPAPKKFIVLHIFGSHFEYDQRYPTKFTKFNKDTSDAVVAKLKAKSRSDKIINDRNSYDNSIVYTDWVLNEFINKVKENNTIAKKYLVYVSDHGEEVGHEKNIAAHNPTVAGLNVPVIIWASKYNSYINPKNKDLQKKYFITDNIFYSMLNLLHVNITLYNATADILNPKYIEPSAKEIGSLITN